MYKDKQRRRELSLHLRRKKMKPQAPARLLLILLLASSLGGAFVWWLQASVLSARLVSSPLSSDELWRLPGYMQQCQAPVDCPQPLKCVYDARVGGHRCLGQECWTDAQCEPGYLCRAVFTMEEDAIHLCLVEGIKGEGETCVPFPLKKEDACRAGLRCTIWYCGRPCRLGDPSSCPHGQVCVSRIEGPACVPSCLQTGCPTGQRCVPVGREFAVCGTLQGEDCEAHPCPEGQECITWVTGGTGVIQMWCEQRCDERQPCPEGLACADGFCRRPCDPEKPDACGAQETCQRGSRPPRLWVCEHS